MSAAPNILPVETVSITEWIKQALTSDTLPPTTSIYLNGQSERPEVKEAIETLALIHKVSSHEGAKKTWDDRVAKTIPDIAEIVNRPKLIHHISEFEFEPPVEWLIPNEVPDKAFTVIYGQSGAAKSFLAIDYAAQVAREREIIYVAAEGKSGYFARYSAWLKHCGYMKPGKFNLVPKAIQLLKENEVSQFIEECRSYKPALIIIDTLSRSMVGGDENNQKDMGMFVHSCDMIREQLDCAVIVVHHTGKTGDNERGSSVLRGAADMMISVSNEEGIIKIGCGKAKDSKPFEHRYCRLQEVTITQNKMDIVSCVLEMWQKVRFDQNALSANQTRLLECLSSELFSEGVRAPDLKAYSNIQGSSFYSALNILMKRGYVYKKGRGAKIDPVVISQKGMDWIRSKANPDGIEKGMEL